MNVKQSHEPGCYNTCVSRIRSALPGIIIILPLFLTGILQIQPYPEAISEANAALYSVDQGKSSAVEDLSTLLDFQPWRSDLWERLGREYLDSENFTAAIDAFEKGDNFGKLSTDGKIAWADALISGGELDSAKELLRLTASNESDLFSLLQIIALQRRISDVFGAEATLLKANQLFPENAEIAFQLGLMLCTTQPDSAIQFLSHLQGDNQNDLLLKDALITTIEKTDSISAAERFLQIGQVLSTFEEWDVARQAFQSALDIDPKSALALIYLAEAKQQLGMKAFENIDQAMKLAPENEIVNGLAGLYYRRQAKNELSLIYLNKAAEINPDAAVWIIEKGRTYEQMGDLETAFKLLIEAVDQAPKDWTTWKALAVFCITHNYDVEETGLEAARKALALNPSSPVLMDLLGTGLMLSGDFDSAERFFIKALNTDPHQSAILIHLGQLKIYQQDLSQAKVYLQQAIDFAPSNRLRDLAIQLLNEKTGN